MTNVSTQLLHEVCAIPTAPFAEQRVIAFVEQFVRKRRRLTLSRDRFGNLLIELKGTSRGPRWVFGAHMDHPGMVAERMIDAKTLEAAFRGGVLTDYVVGTRVRFFDGNREVVGKVLEADPSADRKTYPQRVRVRVKQTVSPGSIGMFDLPTGAIKGKKFHSRVCDDLAGAAAALAMIDALHKNPPKSTTCVLLTRAEEEGFIGAIAAAAGPTLLRKSDRIIAIENSAMQPFAPQGKGPIIRVGDLTSVFNSDLSYHLTNEAKTWAEKDKTFAWQRALMPGGTCEATVYDVYGFITSSICLALGNYHNMDKARGKIAPEFIDVNDWCNMVRLFTQIARNGHTWKPGHKALRTRLEQRFAKWEPLLRT